MAGRPRSVPAQSVVSHIQQLMATGMTAEQVAREAGVDPSAIRWSLSGRKKTLLRRTANRILSVPVGVKVAVGTVPAEGAVRRVQALYAIGHFNRQIAELSGVSRDFICDLVNGRHPRIGVQSNAGIRRAYAELSMTVGGSVKTRLYAQAKGWVPPLAWDDDTIEDPAALPMLDVSEPQVETGAEAVARFLMGESVLLGAAERREAIQHFMEWTEMTPVDIAVRMEVSARAVSRAWERIKKDARDAGQPVPWRRKLESPRSRTIGQVAA
ncbi:hypothetical protein [Streptomyces sp. Ac-502]|uniref:hypothetical protein n=1 Tax=Streptomyces sp. Ac-502 TaxID=3342801 RepID=UPI00386264FD